MPQCEFDTPLGKQADYSLDYDPSLLCPIPRQIQRNEIGVQSPLPFFGVDLWNSYELSWLDRRGKPMVAIATWWLSCDSPFLVESKSIKLYLNSLNRRRFGNVAEVSQVISADLSAKAGSLVTVSVQPLPHTAPADVREFTGQCLDILEVSCDCYHVQPALLQCQDGQRQSETVYSNLLRSNCLVTNQPDWGSVQISYTGNPISHASLLQYIVSYREHNEFHEQCVERIFMDILRQCQPEKLTVYARYTRRGGIDINPIRATEEIALPSNLRCPRQ